MIALYNRQSGWAGWSLVCLERKTGPSAPDGASG